MQRHRASLLILFMLLGLILPTLAQAADDTVTVQPGDTLTSIAARNGTTVDALVAANDLPSANVIYAGQNLVIPGNGGGSAPVRANTTSAGGRSYTVQPGDYLSNIAEAYGISTNALMDANGISNPNLIFAGQNLTVPTAAAAPPPAAPVEQPKAPAPPPAAPAKPAASGSSYTVRPGDNLADIAARYGVSLSALAATNNIANPTIIYDGQVLSIPAGGAAAPPPAQPAAPTSTPVKAAGQPKDTMPEPTLPPPNGAKPAPPPPTIGANEPVIAPKNTPAPPPAAPPAGNKGDTIKYTVKAGDVLYSIAAAHGTTVDAIVARNNIANPNAISVGQVLTIVVGDTTSKPAAPVQAAQVAPPKPVTGTGGGGKWIDVDIGAQRITAYEGDNPVFTSLVSTGTSNHPTVIGTFRIQTKYLADDMTGGYGAEYYYLPDVPYTMYFYSGYAIHGTYWHHNFGTPMSHGCVNLPTDAAKWMFEWAPIGTPVTTHW